MIDDKNIENTVASVAKEVDSIANDMAIGDRFTTKEFITKVMETVDIPVAIATGITVLVINNCDDLMQRAGRNGGVYKIKSTASKQDIEAIASAITACNETDGVIEFTKNDDVYDVYEESGS